MTFSLTEWRSLLILWVLLRSTCGAFSLKRPTFSSTTALSSTTSLDDPNLELLSARGKAALENLKEYDSELREQTHVYENWPPPGTSDEEKIALCEQVRFCIRTLRDESFLLQQLTPIIAITMDSARRFGRLVPWWIAQLLVQSEKATGRIGVGHQSLFHL